MVPQYVCSYRNSSDGEKDGVGAAWTDSASEEAMYYPKP